MLCYSDCHCNACGAVLTATPNALLQLKSVVFREAYTLETLSDALTAITERKTYGKVVVDVQPQLETESLRSKL